MPKGLDDSIGSDRSSACAAVCTPGVSLGFREFGYLDACGITVAATDGFADGQLTGPSSCDPTTSLTYPITSVAAYHATVDPTRSTLQLDVGSEVDDQVAGTIAFDFDIPLSIGSPSFIFFEDIQLASSGDPVVQVFEANDVFAAVDPEVTAFHSTGVLPVRWRDAAGAYGINPQSSAGWSGQIDVAARTLVFDYSGADPFDETATFTMHVEATIDDLPPVADPGPDVTLPCASPTGTPVVLDASASSDPDPGDTITHVQWLVFGGSPAISDKVQAMVTLSVGTSAFELHVYDKQLGAGYKKHSVTITPSTNCP